MVEIVVLVECELWVFLVVVVWWILDCWIMVVKVLDNYLCYYVLDYLFFVVMVVMVMKVWR